MKGGLVARRVAPRVLCLVGVMCMLGLATGAAAADLSTDVSPPVLHALSGPSGPVDVSAGSAEVVFHAAITDDLSGVAGWGVPGPNIYVSNIGLRSPSGSQAVFGSLGVVSGDPSDSFTAFVDLPRYAEAGHWTVDRVWLFDQVGNSHMYERAELLGLGFDVGVDVGVDRIPPSLMLPEAVSVEASGSTGAVVAFTVTASDDVDPSPAVLCTPASRSLFPLGSTKVNCAATDASGNSASGSFTVTVVDTTPPTLTLPASKVVNATGPGGVAVVYTATATDTVDRSPAVVCSPPSGSVFAIGATTVNCTATDASGNGAQGSFTIKVEGAVEQLANLAAEVKRVGPGTSLADKVAETQVYVSQGGTGAACEVLTAFVNEVQAHSGKIIPSAQAAGLIADAKRIKTVIGCTN